MSTIHTTLSFLFLFILNFRDLFAQLCDPEQRDALLEVKKQFDIGDCSGYGYMNENGTIVSPHPKTESWKNNTDCCYWDGITCDPRTGKVIELKLEKSCLHGRFHSNTLQNLASLIILDLSFNDLYGQIWSSVGKLSHLTSLNISNNKFSGQIPSSIGKLYDLTSLVLSDNQFSGQIPYSIGRLSNLTYLALSINRFSGQIPSSIGNLSNLTYLDLSYNQFSGQIPYSIGNLSYLTSLSLSNNQFLGQIPYSIGNLSHIAVLDFSGNNFVGELPSTFGSLHQLTYLNVGFNKLSGNFPIAILNLTNLSGLSLSNNQFTGTIPPNITSLSNLEYLYADNNAFVGTLHSSLSTIPSVTNNQLDNPLLLPSKLRWLSLGSNRFTGPIPRSISKLVNLQVLDLSHWNTQGPVDFNIFSHLKSLIDLYLSYLNTTTRIDLTVISSISESLDTLDLSGSHVFATNKSSVSDPPSKLLSELILRGCGITEFPELIRTQQNLDFLDISSNKMTGQVPGWLWTLPKLRSVDLSNNNFIGMERSTKQRLSSELVVLVISNNNFTGNIPSLICELGSLIDLDLSVNDFNGSIPHCLENLKSNLSYLNLRYNHLTGGLPQSVFPSLQSIDVGHNQLVGKLPRSLMNFSALEVLNVESNRIKDVFPLWLSSLQNLQILVLRSNAFYGPLHQASFLKLKIIDISYNQFSGTLPSDYFVGWSSMSSLGTDKYQSKEKYMEDESGYYSIVLKNKGFEIEIVRILKVFTALDFSGNGFEGEIPDSIGLLKDLYSLSLSNNAFTGHIPSSMRNLTSLESLDVSQNKLSGQIPQELGTLSFLSYMNFSNNQLVGLVPGGTQFGTQPCSSYANNPGLFGPALDEACSDIHTPSQEQYETPDAEENEEEEVFSWIAAAIGFGPGIAFGMTMGYVFVYNKPEWFRSPFGRNKRRSRGTTTR